MPIENILKDGTLPGCIGEPTAPIAPNKCQTCDSEVHEICFDAAIAKHTVKVVIPMPETIYNLLRFRTEPHETFEEYLFHLIIKGFNTEEKEAEGK